MKQLDAKSNECDVERWGLFFLLVPMRKCRYSVNCQCFWRGRITMYDLRHVWHVLPQESGVNTVQLHRITILAHKGLSVFSRLVRAITHPSNDRITLCRTASTIHVNNWHRQLMLPDVIIHILNLKHKLEDIYTITEQKFLCLTWQKRRQLQRCH